jgi:hypothetical protein
MSTSTHSWKGLSLGAKVFIGLVIAAGMASLLQASIHQSSKNIAEFICYLGIAILASRLRVTLPGITGTLSVNFLFILVGIAELSYSEAITLGAISMLAQCFYPNRPTAIQLTFNVCAGSLSTALGYIVYHDALVNELIISRPLVLCLAATTYGCDFVQRRETSSSDSGGLLFLVFPLLPAWSRYRGCDRLV